MATKRMHKQRLQRLTKQVSQLENKVHQAIAVLDADSGKLLNYRQLTKHPKNRKGWKLLLANKFGRLADGVE